MLLVAVSGGIDSMCLAEKVRLEGGPFAIAHCNFHLRGKESDGDEAFVKAWADANGIPCHVRHFETSAYATEQGISVEMAARRLRYHWFGELCRQHGYSGVAVAHNANDNAETLLLNLLRGTGIRGLLGMKAEGFIPDPEFSDIPLLRPLLGMTRADIEAFAARQGLSWREDATNALNDFKRNKIRNLVFPVFREINPSFIQTLNRNMERFAEALPAEVLSSEPVATLGRIRGRGPLPAGQWEGRRGVAPEGSEDSTSAGRVFVHEKGTFGVREVEFEVKEEVWDGTKEVKQPAGMLILDADKAGELVEGSWETGDWIRPLGAPGKKKLQDWFTDHHIPADEKPFVRLYKRADDPHHVVAIAGWCIDHSVRVTQSTRRILRISAKND
ncbi:MAG: tRNA lysidine(34) synthetase TilS [Bacteroidales bacterium]|nr:tRNA lysidine(34) synthetase TilS [Bacteroidales bacterium]